MSFPLSCLQKLFLSLDLQYLRFGVLCFLLCSLIDTTSHLWFHLISLSKFISTLMCEGLIKYYSQWKASVVPISIILEYLSITMCWYQIHLSNNLDWRPWLSFVNSNAIRICICDQFLFISFALLNWVTYTPKQVFGI